MVEHIHFYYTNDFHSYFSQWSRVASFMKGKKIKHRLKEESCWLIDIGDHLDRVHPITEASMGKANVQVLNDVGYDMVTFGNNEGITLSHDDFYHLYDDADFEVVCANLQNRAGDNPNWLNDYVQIQSIGGVRIGVIGLTVAFNDFYHLLHWHVSSPYEVLEKHLEILSEKVDVIVLLSHLGINWDRKIASRFPKIDVIIGGHTHHLFKEGEYVGNTLLTAAGKNCFYVGEVHFEWDHKQQKLVKKEAVATDITEYPKDLITEQSLFTLQKQSEDILNKEVVYLDESILVRWFKHTKIMQQLTDSALNWTKAEGAMLNAGLLLDDFPAGAVTYADVHRICPHPINLCVVSITGRNLMNVIQTTLKREFTELKLKGFGFRGEILGKMIFSNITFEKTRNTDGGFIISDVWIHGKPLEQNKTYQIATADSFTFGRLIPEIAQSETKVYYLPEFLRDVLSKTLMDNYGI
ncbi:bifunctional metallophosphatase/5'-nucleotidase [Cerasibacillus terrae]|uniref:Bifunctional metallophosphatase/5'-nucleotidase n=1 Tax=Cerasibacillus terrae TaxID=2498845 RepID=A0A5C8NJ66_9BACI|nr:bifunctional UDP-sugar hydrolase/5'-nucleotidase [Cerasibacillus terrae]TXL58126.1 bifunctional metallophosphatase/5'-nucleotidase [Cerasibacillus terrae]